MNFKSKSAVAALVTACAWATAGHATPIQPVSYEMQNGQSGYYTYYDDTYNGNGSRSSSLSFLAGGVGDLTDGIIATGRWYDDPAAYVGWSSVDPLITFDFGDIVNIDAVTLYVDDSNGMHGVAAPGSVSINGNLFAITDPAGTGALAVTISNLGFSGSTLDIQLFDGIASWVFLSEVSFESRALVAEPATLALFGFGLIGLAAGRRRRT